MFIFTANLIIGSIVMSIISLIFILVSSALKKTWSAKSRRTVWMFITLGFILSPLPLKLSPEASVTALGYSEASQTVFLVFNSGIHYFPRSSLLISLIFFIWLAGFLAFLISCYVKQYRFNSYVTRLASPCSDEYKLTAMELAYSMNICIPRVMVLKNITTPMLVGLSRPTVLIPDVSYSKPELTLILRHEFTHMKRKDIRFKALFVLCNAIHWFNPLVHFISRRIDTECELACDEEVIRGIPNDARKLYCTAILNTALHGAVHTRPLSPALATSLQCGKHSLKNRLEMIVSAKNRKIPLFVCFFIILIVTFLSSYTVIQSDKFGDGATVTTTVYYTVTDGNTYRNTTTFDTNISPDIHR